MSKGVAYKELLICQKVLLAINCMSKGVVYDELLTCQKESTMSCLHVKRSYLQ